MESELALQRESVVELLFQMTLRLRSRVGDRVRAVRLSTYADHSDWTRRRINSCE